MKHNYLHSFKKNLRKYRKLLARYAEASEATTLRVIGRKINILKRRLLRLNRTWKLGLSTAALLAGMTSSIQAQTFPASMNLDTLGSNGIVINGVAEDDESGQSVSNAGDLNGDGIDDIVIGAPDASPNGSSYAGQAYVVFGSSSPATSLELSNLNGSNGFVINGIDQGDNLGYSVSGVGDVNGDGIDDLIIGALKAAPNGNNDAGESYVIFGSNTFPASINLTNLNGSNGFVINGIDEEDYSGLSVSGAGDVNGDGIDDIVIGAPDADPKGKSRAGETYVVFGSRTLPASLDLSNLNGSNGFTINGIDQEDYAGFSVSGAGDVNGDGMDDIIIGAYKANPNGNSDAGETYVVFGSNNPPVSLDLDTLGINGVVINGIDAYDYSGQSVSSAGDVNGDGIDDIIIGAYNAAPGGRSYAGETYVVFGSNNLPASLDLSNLNGNNGFIINGIDIEDYAGASVSSAGDINGDGIDDMIIGAHYADPSGNSYAGETYVVFGSNTPPASLDLSTLNGSNGFVINGIDPGDYSGQSVSGAGDVNGDGIDDLIIGAYEADSNGNYDIGETYVIFGRAMNTNVDELTPNLTLDIFPNPASEVAFVHVQDLQQATDISLSLFDPIGRKVPIAFSRDSSDRLRLDLAGLTAGNYVLRVMVDGELGVARLVKK